MNRWILGLLMLVIVIFGMVFVAISEIESNAAHPNPFNYGTCPNSQFATAVTTSTLNCALPPAQTNEYYGSCPLGQYATAITTTTLNCTTVQTQTSQFFSYGTCPVNQYATAVTTTTLNCASASNSNYLTTQTSAFFSYGTCPNKNYATAITTTTLNCGSLPINIITTIAAPNPTSANAPYPNYNMSGLGRSTPSFTYTPTITGKLFLSITMSLEGNHAAPIGTSNVEMTFGTGTAPINGVGLTGTPFGSNFYLETPCSNCRQEVVLQGSLSLSVGTAYWFDIALEAYSGAGLTITIASPILTIVEFSS